MIKYIFTQLPEADCQAYFDGDCFSENSGDYNNTLFIIASDFGRKYGLNIEEYKNIEKQAEELLDCFDYATGNGKTYDGKKYTFKQAMTENGLKYNPAFCHNLKEWHKTDPDTRKTETIAQFLTIKTGKKWSIRSVYGYCQGDYAEVIFCEENYKFPSIHGEIWLGCCKEFSLTYVDENGEQDETNTVYGYYVADCQTRTEEDYKTVLCEMEGTKPEETEVNIISNEYTKKVYEYKII